MTGDGGGVGVGVGGGTGGCGGGVTKNTYKVGGSRKCITNRKCTLASL